MEVTYQCRCMAKEALVWVPDRQPTQDILDWIERVVSLAIARHHRGQNPLCAAKEIDIVKIPIHDNTQIGTRPASQP
jgi:hypothetical protein